ncbi:unnamed protein product [Haemonchus placei]|uniref:DOMON domain-containing protein n=1 Tax=Haemonchus placei TaxID=6290 RepID=A0A0N4WMS9_HAEPC|nr:unnamed protein product [Haemonchus placei]
MSLVATAGREVDGRTVIMFRRSIKEIEPTDHPLGPGRLFVVWAKGQQQDAYFHRAPSALEHSNLKVPFYEDDIVKYHGSKNRGTHFIDFAIPVKLKKSNDARVSISAGKCTILSNRYTHLLCSAILTQRGYLCDRSDVLVSDPVQSRPSAFIPEHPYLSGVKLSFMIHTYGLALSAKDHRGPYH